MSLTTRLLAVNLIALGLLAFSLLYLDSYRNQLLAERLDRARVEAEITAEALALASDAERPALLASLGTRQHLRLRLFDPHGRLLADSFALAPPAFTLRDPARDPLFPRLARLIDRAVDTVVGAAPVATYVEPRPGRAADWPEIVTAAASHRAAAQLRYAPDRTPMISAAVPVDADGTILLTLRNSPEVTQSIRDARQVLAELVGVALLISVAFSLFLARTIVRPLRMLVRAAVRVRLGRERAVVVPRLPERRDEIGLLARALSDMSLALTQRIDAVGAFAADVAHELKNPLASLRSALDSLVRVDEPELRGQLTAIALHDVRRIDRLVTEIADASRIDAELSRATFEPVDLFTLVSALVGGRERRGANRHCQVRAVRAGRQSLVVAGDPVRLERLFDNLLDNAVSFSPPGGMIDLTASADGETVTVEVIDEGPGIAPEARERVFERFHSLRPDAEDFGSHSGLGLAIARTIAEAHDGTLRAEGRADGHSGARLVLRLPAWPEAAG
ncbi:MAG: sensor N-terminal transmembrane domain-containing protein [Proteobacteria bacterium]|nr:sensor N-terminal transmembrane domain-containing protein [Pseudomonadota bacterium]